jgi:DNA primase
MNDIASALFSIAPRLQAEAKRAQGYVLIQCPFHGGGQERTPSCSVSYDKPVFFCHGCKESGHVSRLLKALGLSKDAVTIVLASTGLDKPTHTYSGRGKVAARLLSGTNPYRGRFILDEDLLDDYRVAPRQLLRAGYKKETLRHFEVGYDAANMRITYPLRNIYGELVGVSGRELIDGMTDARYKIYDRELKSREGFNVPPEYTMEGVKDCVLWHGHIVYPFMYHTEDEALIITEGFKACMWTWQSGYQNVVALVGSYLTEMHANLIGTVVQYVVLFLDNNEAGWKGTLRAGRLLTDVGCHVRVAQYPDERGQPDDLQPDELKLAIRNSEPYFNWRQREHVRYHEAPYWHSLGGKALR